MRSSSCFFFSQNMMTLSSYICKPDIPNLLSNYVHTQLVQIFLKYSFLNLMHVCFFSFTPFIVWFAMSRVFKRKVKKIKMFLPKGGIQCLRGHNFVLFWPRPTSEWTFLTLNVDKNRDFFDHLPPLLVHVVIERPQIISTHWELTGLNVEQTFSPVIHKKYQ